MTVRGMFCGSSDVRPQGDFGANRRRKAIIDLPFSRRLLKMVVVRARVEAPDAADPTCQSTGAAVAVLQQQARRWLAEEASNYSLVTSQFVLDEASLCDPDAAARRLALLSSIPLLLPDARVEAVAEEIVSRSLMPATARLDALHVASAAVAGVEYLLTQNCRHIANAHVLPRVYELLEELGLPRLLICTPAEFLGDTNGGS